MPETRRDISWAVVFRIERTGNWVEWSTGHRTVPEVVGGAEVLAKLSVVEEIRFDRTTRQTDRFSLAELGKVDDEQPSYNDVRWRAENAEIELRTLRSGIRALGGDPTQVQNLWAQLHMRNKQWAQAKRDAEAHRLNLSEALGLGTGAPWDVIRDRAAELRRTADEAQQPETRKACGCGQDGCEYCDVDEADQEQPDPCSGCRYAPCGNCPPAAVSQPGKEPTQ